MSRGPLRVVVNLSESRWTVPLDATPDEVVLAWEPEQTKPRPGGLHLPPGTAAIVRIGQDGAGV